MFLRKRQVSLPVACITTQSLKQPCEESVQNDRRHYEQLNIAKLQSSVKQQTNITAIRKGTSAIKVAFEIHFELAKEKTILVAGRDKLHYRENHKELLREMLQ
jgi:hypothetical protein